MSGVFVSKYCLHLFGLLLLFTAVPRGRAQSQEPKGTVYLPNPTPRDRDLHDLYSDDPALRARQQQAAALIKAQRRVQIVADTNEIVTLAQEMQERRTKDSVSNASGSEAVTAQKIEALAKRVKEYMKSQ